MRCYSTGVVARQSQKTDTITRQIQMDTTAFFKLDTSSIVFRQTTESSKSPRSYGVISALFSTNVLMGHLKPETASFTRYSIATLSIKSAPSFPRQTDTDLTLQGVADQALLEYDGMPVFVLIGGKLRLLEQMHFVVQIPSTNSRSYAEVPKQLLTSRSVIWHYRSVRDVRELRRPSLVVARDAPSAPASHTGLC